MKKILSVILALSMCLTLGVLLTACGHEHTWDTVWDTDETYHWHVCTGEECTEVSDKGEHEWDAGEITSEPTATADGVKTFKCKVCGDAKKEPVKAKTDVTAAEWETALKMNAENYAWTMEMKIAGDVKIEMTQVIKRNGTNVQGTTVTNIPAIDENTPAVEEVENIYYSKEGDKYYMYMTIEEETVKEEIDEEAYKASLDNGLAEMFKFEDFQYANGAYTAAEVTVGEGEFATTFTNVTFKFVDGKLAIFNYTQVEEGGNVVVESVVEYGKVPNIILPVVTPAA